MTRGTTIFRILRSLGLFAGLSCAAWGHAAVPTGSVIALEQAEGVDLVLIEAGLGQGFRQGMSCVVSREGRHVADLLLVESRESVCSALIVGMKPGQLVMRRDLVVVKTLNKQ